MDNKDLEMAKEIERVYRDTLNYEAAYRQVTEQYKKAHYSTDQSKSYEHNKTFNDIITDKEDIDNNEVYDISTGETTRDL